MGYHLWGVTSHNEEVTEQLSLSALGEARLRPDFALPELEPTQAPGVFAEAVQTLKGTPSDAEVLRAWGDLHAACDLALQEACRFLDAEFIPSKNLDDPDFEYPFDRKLLERGIFLTVVFRYRIDAEGRLQDGEFIEWGPREGTRQIAAKYKAVRFRPATLAGHRLDAPTQIFMLLGPMWVTLMTPGKLEWAWRRANSFPESGPAWTNLAMQLAVHAPDDPRFPKALERAHALAPLSWWAATEVAWQRVLAGQYAAALMAVRPAWHRERPHPYVLETAAAALFGLGCCEEALKEQERAMGSLPKDWPQLEQERFRGKLKEYQTACVAPPAAPAPHVSAGSGPR
ncbi:hypothetical protein D7V88_22535 [Corallococcus terminator]|uniref:Tetratricopeptide repeat protein n=2 Tax=Corallococcus terminator TaxID=2316733 RepID=A0A3A8IN91_9BACT|nr:hypothetical protein D7V88_22535 [Corallococcus terminator]